MVFAKICKLLRKPFGLNGHGFDVINRNAELTGCVHDGFPISDEYGHAQLLVSKKTNCLESSWFSAFRKSYADSSVFYGAVKINEPVVFFLSLLLRFFALVRREGSFHDGKARLQASPAWSLRCEVPVLRELLPWQAILS